jgi:ligand-binding SRPBCC domain-containing protein
VIHTLHRVQRIPLPRKDVFPFFADAGNLGRITPPELHFRFETPLPVEMRAGALIDYRLRLLGVPIRWRTRIDVWEPDERFVDSQVRGPYALWEHTHVFRDCDGGTEMEDSVRWALPLVPLGEIVRPLVRRELERIFDFRIRAIGEIFGLPATRARPPA